MKKNIAIILLVLFLGWVWIKPAIENWYWMYYQSSAHICEYDTNGDGFKDGAKDIGKVKYESWDWHYMQPNYHTVCPFIN